MLFQKVFHSRVHEKLILLVALDTNAPFQLVLTLTSASGTKEIVLM